MAIRAQLPAPQVINSSPNGSAVTQPAQVLQGQQGPAAGAVIIDGMPCAVPTDSIIPGPSLRAWPECPAPDIALPGS